ncbi:hypothetical protein INS49_012987 [Diaporthe citri]|uniref:uncharacterized protein n=1 Tax=Diaporthe citri TaxID=83186 RepID=UPI001C80B6A9|nr:uncharacterized protein INS49_012987 [Diaporthe citri]KAG6359466.1 hypothetical protein INS49_012987 [Diaporthe citri]
MSALQQIQGNTAMSRFVRPKLTIDTRVHSKPNVDPLSTQSAPAYPRQERGVPPMHQAVDRYCTKVAEMMNSPTWRSQRPGPNVVDDSTPSEPLGPHDAYTPNSLGSCVEDDGECHSIREHGDVNGTLSDLARQRTLRRHADSGISLGRDAEAMSILGIHPFSEIPNRPANAFIISAAVSNGAAHSRGTIYGELQPVMFPRQRPDIQSKTAEDELSFDLTSEDEYLGSLETGFQSSRRSLSHSPSQPENVEILNDQELIEGEKAKKNKEREIHQLMERDEAIKSVNSQHASPRRNRRPDPEDKSRFQGLLGRLRYDAEALTDDRADMVALNDPAIVSFAPKKSAQYSSNEEFAPRRHIEEKCPPKGSHHTSSDSGYASPTTRSRPSTRTQSRSRPGTSDEIGSEPVTIQHGDVDSKDFEPDRPSKFSTLNPAAKVFSSANDHSASPKKRGGLAPAPVPDHAFFSPLLAQAQFGTGIQSQNFGYNALPNFGSPLTNLALTQPGLLQLSSALIPQNSSFPQPILPPPPGLGLTANLPPGIQSPGTMPGLPLLPPPSRVTLPGLAHSPGLMSTSGPISSDFTGAFHQQLPTIPSCNNPAHQSAPAFNGTPGFPAPTMPQLAPPVPPTSMLSPNHGAPVPPPLAPVAPVVNPIFRKNVPKPKVPNTTGQQYWEYWHELRRTFEPGYAQKSKQNQQKRYMKQQTHKNGGTTDQT